VQRSGTAECDERKAAWVEAFLHGARADRVRHVGIDDREDALGRFLETEAKPLGQTAGGAPRCHRIEPHRAAQKIIGIQPAEHEIGIGHRGLGAASSIGGRSGIGPGAARADAKSAGAVDIGDRPAAGADRVDIDHRRQHRVSSDPCVSGRRLGKAPVDDDADIGRGAADVERDQPIALRQRATPGAAEDTGGWPREQRRYRDPGDGRWCRNPAI
jgi:hypothetical protein